MGVGGKIVNQEIYIFNCEDGDEMTTKARLELEEEVNSLRLEMNLTAKWKFSDSFFSLISNSYKGLPEQIIPHFLVIWKKATEMDHYIDGFTLPFSFEQNSGVFKFNGETLRVYDIPLEGVPSVTSYNLDDLDNWDDVFQDNVGPLRMGNELKEVLPKTTPKGSKKTVSKKKI